MRGSEEGVWALHGSLGGSGDWPDGVRGIALYERLAPYWEFAASLNQEASEATGRPLLVGYSLGGRLALHALLAAPPGTWRGAVIVSAHPGLRSARDRGLRLAADAEWARKAREMEWGAFVREWDGQAVLGGSGTVSGGGREESRREAVARGFELWSLGRQDDLGSRLADVRCPMLWVTGERDAKFRALADGLEIPHQVVAGAGHRVPWDCPDAFWEVVWQFDSACRKLC